MDKEHEFFILLGLCEKLKLKTFILDLLKEFSFLKQATYNQYLHLLTHWIISSSGFNLETTQIAAIAYDDGPDSSQKVVNDIKVFMGKTAWAKVKHVNKYGAIPSNYNKGLTQIVFLDEFIGSGKTILTRIKQLKADIKGNFELKCCFIAGMDFAIKKIEAEGYEVFCPLILKRGITDFYEEEDFKLAISKMLELEAQLSSSINDVPLENYSFGYNKAESLYALEFGNPPNSNFPILWWPIDAEGNERNTLLNRYELEFYK